MEKLNITVRANLTLKKIEKEYEKLGIKISDYSKGMISKIDFPKKGKKYQVEIWTVKELGFDNWTTYKDIKEKAFSLGLDLCPPELALEVRKEYKGDWVVFAMNPIIDRDGDLRLFDCYRRGSESWLDSYYGHDVYEWAHSLRFFFVRKPILKTLEKRIDKNCEYDMCEFNRRIAKQREEITQEIAQIPSITRAINATESAQYISKDTVLSIIRKK